MSTQEEREAAGRAAFQAVIDAALDWPVFLASTMPKDPNDPEVTERIKKLAALALRLNPLERRNTIESVFRYNRGIPRAPARKMFDDEIKRLEGEAEATAASAESEARGKRRQSAVGDEMRGHVFTKSNGCIYRKSAIGAEERVTSFSLVPTHRIAKDGEVDDWIRCRIEIPYEGFDAGTEGAPLVQVYDAAFPFPPKAFTSRHAFKSIMPNECAGSPSDDDVQGIKEMFKRDYGLSSLPRLQSTNVLGRHMVGGSPRFVRSEGTIGPDGQWMETADLTYLYGDGVGSTSTLASKMPGRKDARPALDSPELRELARAALADVMRLNRGEDMAALVGWHFAALVAPAIRLKLAGAPILNVVGSAQAGKSSLAGRILWPMFAGARADGELMSWKGTRFTMAKEIASCNALALCWDENREGSSPGMQKTHAEFYDMLRGSYTKEVVTRGNQDKTITLYVLQALSNVNGETRIAGDQALVERCVFVVLDGNWLAQHPECRAAYDRMTALDLAALGPFMQAWTMRLDVAAALAEAREMVGTALKRLGRAGRLTTRAVANVEWVATGIVMFNRLADELSVATPAVEFVSTVDRMVREMFEEDQGASRATLHGAEGRVRTNVDAALVEWSTMATGGELKEGRDFVWVERAEGLRLCLSLSQIMGRWLTWRLSQGRSGPPVGQADLYRKACEMVAAGGSYVTGADRKTRAPFDDGRRRCLEVDPAKIPDSLDVDSFPRNELKTHGGQREQLSTQELLDRFGKKTN